MIEGRAGADFLLGGGGNDWVSYEFSQAPVNVSLKTGFGSGGHASGDTLQGFEGLEGSYFADMLEGSEGGDTLVGSRGNDTLTGAGGDDSLWGGRGDDVFVFARGHGVDRIQDFNVFGQDRIDLRALGVSRFEDVDARAYSDPGRTEPDHVLLDLTKLGGGTVLIDYFDFSELDASDFIFADEVAGTATYTVSSTDNDYLRGDSDNNLLNGGGGNDTLYGGPGNDTLYGGDGVDELDGGDGDDYLSPGNSNYVWERVAGSRGNDTIDFSGNETGYQAIDYRDADLDTGIEAAINGVTNTANVNKGPAGTDTILNVANPMTGLGFRLHGTQYADEFEVRLDDSQWMLLEGGAGNDTFDIQGSGTVRLAFPSSGHGIHVDLGADTVIDDGFGDTDVMNGTVLELGGSPHSDHIIGSADNETFYGGGGHDTIEGREGDDKLYGGDVNDVLQGEDDDDILAGQAANDVLNGGAGDDRL